MGCKGGIAERSEMLTKLAVRGSYNSAEATKKKHSLYVEVVGHCENPAVYRRPLALGRA